MRSQPRQKLLNDGGLIISIIGADGTGKSTQTARVTEELGKRFDTHFVYMGAGDGPSSWHRKPLKLLKRIFGVREQKPLSLPDKKRLQENRMKAELKNSFAALHKIFKFVWAISLAFERKAKLEKLAKLRSQGAIAICDRYPQDKVFGYNDGPLLNCYGKSEYRILRRISFWERSVYGKAITTPPDLVFMLEADPDIIRSRRPDMSIDLINEKQNAIKEMTFAPSTKVISILTNKDVDEVFMAIMLEVNDQIIQRSV